ncbi:MAG: OmpA family protein [Bryobacterales bacterium]|nr:OmpA family protein [Bryobacterales bacterium]
MVGIDKPGRSTGPGDGGFLVTEQDVPSNVVFEFILFNYNIDGNLLKREHKELLDRHLVPFLKANQVHTELTGTASRAGAASYNRQLSLERVHRVRQYLLHKGVSPSHVPVSDLKAIGEDSSTSKSNEDALDRSVRIRIVVGVKPVSVLPNVVVPQPVSPKGPKPPAPVQVLPEVVIEADNRVPWAILELSGFHVGVSVGFGAFGVGAGVQVGTVEYHFLLFNMRTRQMAECRFLGPAAGGGLGPNSLKPGVGPSAGMSMTQNSNAWDTFHTKAGIGFDDFAGSASWVEPGGLGLGSSISLKAELTFHGLDVTARVSTGHTIGTPGSLVSRGNFRVKAPFQTQN